MKKQTEVDDIYPPGPARNISRICLQDNPLHIYFGAATRRRADLPTCVPIEVEQDDAKLLNPCIRRPVPQGSDDVASTAAHIEDRQILGGCARGIMRAQAEKEGAVPTQMTINPGQFTKGEVKVFALGLKQIHDLLLSQQDLVSISICT